MKKAYIEPACMAYVMEAEDDLLTVSGVGGDAGIDLAGDDDDVPGTANAPASVFEW